MPPTIKGLGFQWEGNQILPRIRAKYPQYKYVQTEGECGWGAFDWKAAEHTFERINHYLGTAVRNIRFGMPFCMMMVSVAGDGNRMR